MNRIRIDELNGKNGFSEWLSILTNIGIQVNTIGGFDIPNYKRRKHGAQDIYFIQV